MKISERFRRLNDKWNYQATSGEIPDSKKNPIFRFSMTDSELLEKNR